MRLPPGTPAAILLLDVDQLQSVNARRGVAAGDALLGELHEMLRSHVRPDDIVERRSGGTYALGLPLTRRLDALLVAERLRTAIARRVVPADERVTVSAGVASIPDDGTTIEQVEKKARQALLWAKAHGRNLCAVASDVVEEDGDRDPADVLAHLHAVVASIDALHLHTRDHSENVAAYAVALGRALGLDEEHVMRVRRAAFLHDIGKIAVDDAILSKPAALTREEFAQIEIHPVVGARMLHHAGLEEEAVWVRHHHERIDGKGYPDRKSGDDVPFEARIIFVADAFEAMTSDRPYRQGMPPREAAEEIRRNAGTQFDGLVVEAFTRLLDDGNLEVLALRDAPDAVAR